MDTHCLLRAYADPGRLRLSSTRSGFTWVEIAIVRVIAGVLVKIALPSYADYRDKASVAQASRDDIIRANDGRFLGFASEY